MLCLEGIHQLNCIPEMPRGQQDSKMPRGHHRLVKYSQNAYYA